jgi:CHAT domain-containing protein
MLLKRHLLIAIGLGALVGCETLPQSAYVSDEALRSLNPGAAGEEAAVPVGDNEVKEACRYQPGRLDDVDVGAVRAITLRCGTWTQPSGRVFQLRGGASDPAHLEELAGAGAWKAYVDQRFRCQAPAETRILNDVPAVILQCARRNGGWPHLALLTSLDGKTFAADGVLTAFRPLEATLAALGNRAAPSSEGQPSAAYELLAARLARQPFGSGDLDRYFGLMRLGDQYNEVENYASAEDAFRDALAVQQRILGTSDPSSALPMMKLAAQISNQRRFVEADGLFDRAAALSARATDPLIKAELAFYRAAHAANQRKRDEALQLAAVAERSYAALLPSSVRNAGRRQAQIASASAGARFDLGTGTDLFVNPEVRAAVLGLAEVLRVESVLYNRLGDYDESIAKATEARLLLENNGVNPPGVIPRTLRITALSAGESGQLGAAASDLESSARLFQQDTPNERPLAVTYLLAGAALQRDGKPEDALRQFRAGAKILQARHLGAPDALISAFLDALDARAARQPSERDAIYREMFETAQLAQGGLTAQFIAKAAARLAAGDQAASAALRRLQEIELHLRSLFTDRDVEAQRPPESRNADALSRIDHAIADAERERGEAESAVQAAAPAYQQLIQTGAPASDVAKALRPREAFLSIFVGEKVSYGFLITAKQITAYPIEQSQLQMSETVAKLRRSAEIHFDDEGRPDLKPYDLETAHQLYLDLFKPIEALLSDVQELVVSANGPLLTMPLQALVVKPATPATGHDYRKVDWLLRRYAISYVPIPQTFVALRNIKSASAAPKPFIGFGDFRPATPAQLEASFPPDRCGSDNTELAGLAILPGTRREVKTIAAKLGADPESVILGQDFTKEKLASIDLGQYRILHFATHAFLPTEIHCLTEPSLLLSVPRSAATAADGFLQPDEILKLHLQADLVVLSACNTAGPSGQSAGESFSGLARTFFFAGTRGLLATHWSVSDTAAMTVVGGALAGDGGVAPDTSKALRESQLRLLESAGAPEGLPIEFSHPFAWAPFVLIGDGVKPPVPSGPVSGNSQPSVSG